MVRVHEKNDNRANTKNDVGMDCWEQKKKRKTSTKIDGLCEKERNQ